MSPHQSGAIVAVDAGGVVWRGEPSGEEWRQVFRFRPAETGEEEGQEGEEVEEQAVTVRGVAWDPGVAGRVFVAAGKAGLWRSLDDGESWSKAVAGEVFCVAVDSAGVLAGTNAGLLVSGDGGDSFRQVEGLPAVRLVAEQGATVAVATGTGVFLSEGPRLAFQLLEARAGVRALALDAGGSRLLVGTAEGLRIFSRGGAVVAVGHDELPGMIAAVVVAPEGGPVWVLTDAGLFRSIDGGLHFAAVDEGESREAIAVIPGKPDGLLEATPSGVKELGEKTPPTEEVAVPQLRDPLFYADGLASWQRQARFAAFLPVISVQYQLETFQGTPHVVYQTASNRISIVPGLRFLPLAGDELVVTASWNFEELLSSANLSKALRELSHFRRARERQFTRLSRLAVEQRQLQALLAAGIDDPAERTAAQIRIEEIGALLDASQVEISPR